MKLYLLSYYTEEGREEVMEIPAYSEDQAWLFACEAVPAERIISLEYSGRQARQEESGGRLY